MSKEVNNYPTIDEEYENNVEEVDLKKIFNSFIRNKKLIILSGFSGLLLSVIFSLNAKKVYQGEFQIVLSENENSQTSILNSISPNIARLAGFNINSGGNKLSTEVAILKSQLVLDSVFEFVANQKNNFSTNFKSWLFTNLDIELEDKTSVLNIIYKDNDKDIIIPVLKKISDKYQQYSGRKRLRNIELGINYFKDQIQFYENKSNESFKRAEKFGQDQDLNVELLGEDSLKTGDLIVNTEVIRRDASNKIRIIDEQLNQIIEQEDPNLIVFLAKRIPSLEESILNLNSIEERLAFLRLTYKENDKSIQDELIKKELSLKVLKDQVYNSLRANKITQESLLKAAERPEGVLNKYKQLQKESFKDQVTLNKLQDQYRAILLEKARYEDPWELITTPTLIDKPVEPKTKRIIFLGLLGGLFLGCCSSLLIDRKKDLFLKEGQLNFIKGIKVISEISFFKKESWLEELKLLSSGPLSSQTGSIAFLIVGKIDESYFDEINNFFKKFYKNNNNAVIQNLHESIDYESIVLIASLGKTTNREIENLKNKIHIQKKPILGLIALSDII